MDLVITPTVQNSELKTSMFTVICRRHGLSAFDNFSTGCKMNSQLLYDDVLQEAKEIARAITEKSGTE
jgi:hypothetical protein